MPIKLPALGPNPFQPTAPTTGALNVIRNPSATDWKPSPTLESEAAPKTDWWSLAMKIGAPLIGGLAGGKAGLRAGTAFATGVMDEEQRQEKARIEAEDRKRAQDLIKQKREELAQAKAEAKAKDEAAAEARRIAKEESDRRRKITDMEGELRDAETVAANTGDYSAVAELKNRIEALRTGQPAKGGEAYAAAKKAEAAQKAQEEQDKKEKAKSDAMWKKESQQMARDRFRREKERGEGRGVLTEQQLEQKERSARAAALSWKDRLAKANLMEDDPNDLAKINEYQQLIDSYTSDADEYKARREALKKQGAPKPPEAPKAAPKQVAADTMAQDEAAVAAQKSALPKPAVMDTAEVSEAQKALDIAIKKGYSREKAIWALGIPPEIAAKLR